MMTQAKMLIAPQNLQRFFQLLSKLLVVELFRHFVFSNQLVFTMAIYHSQQAQKKLQPIGLQCFGTQITWVDECRNWSKLELFFCQLLLNPQVLNIEVSHTA